MNRIFLTSVMVCAIALMTASAASPSNLVWPDPGQPFLEKIEVCSWYPASDSVSFSLPSDFDSKTVMTVKLRSESWVKAEGRRTTGFSLFDPWLEVNDKDIRISVDWFPAEQTIKINKAGKYLNPGDNKISFSFQYDGDNSCVVGDTCEGCRYWVDEIVLMK